MIMNIDLNHKQKTCYARLNPMENVWEKGFIARKVIGVPDSYVVKIDGRRYHHNKCDLTLSLPDNNNDKGDAYLTL